MYLQVIKFGSQPVPTTTRLRLAGTVATMTREKNDVI